jgi:hypothetical protein
LITGGSPISNFDTVYKTVEVGPATVEISRTGPEVAIKVEGVPDDGQIFVSNGSTEIQEKEEGYYRDKVLGDSAAPVYTISLETPLARDSELVSSGKIDATNLDSYVNLNLVSTRVPNAAGNSMSAFAATSIPSRTRFRYQTFIAEYDTYAPPIACAPASTSDVAVVANFLGDNRSWNPDSDSFKTRSDIVVDWGANGTITPEFKVGETTLVVDYYYSFLPPVRTVSKKTASASGLKLSKLVMNASFVSFRITSDVTNPFCLDWTTKGISYNFLFNVFREGTYVIEGTLLRVPNHELYTRNNIDPQWQTLLQVPNQGFQCLFEYSWGCDVNKSLRGDLIQ